MDQGLYSQEMLSYYDWFVTTLEILIYGSPCYSFEGGIVTLFTAQTLALCLSQERSWKSVVTFSLVLLHKMALLRGKLLETSFRWSLSLIYPSSLLKFASPCPINCTWVGLVMQIVCQRSKQSKTNSDDIQSCVKTKVI